MSYPVVSSFSFDSHGFWALEVDGHLTSWLSSPEIPEPPKDIVVTPVLRPGTNQDYCSIRGCGGSLEVQGAIVVCTNCGAQYGEAK